MCYRYFNLLITTIVLNAFCLSIYIYVAVLICANQRNTLAHYSNILKSKNECLRSKSVNLKRIFSLFINNLENYLFMPLLFLSFDDRIKYSFI